MLSDSNRLVVRLTPCDTVARVASVTHFASAEREVALVRQLAATESPVALLDPRVEPRLVERDGFEIALWAHHGQTFERTTEAYAGALERLHAGLRTVELEVPRFLDRVAATRHELEDRSATPDLVEADRVLLIDRLCDLSASIVDRHAPEQLLHGEPHPWNVLDTDRGPLFIDFENVCTGPVEYDLAWVPVDVSRRYRDADHELVETCRGLVATIITMHRWHRDDQHPSGREGGVAFLDVVRHGPPWPSLDEITW